MIRYLPQLFALALPIVVVNATAAAVEQTPHAPLMLAQQQSTDTKPDGDKPKPPEEEEEPDC